jgi:hypothetical protein
MKVMQLDRFPQETIDKLGNYVYRLIDPRNGNTFYVGVGKGNRVFDHVKGAIKFKDEDNSISLKAGTINDIRSSGLEIIHVIQRYGMSKEIAHEVEAALIDSYPGLTNTVSGHYSSVRGIISAYEIEYQTKLSVFEEPKDFKYMIIKTKAWKNDGWASEMGNPIYEATRMSWVVSLDSVKDYKYVLSVYDSVVVEVFEIEKWHELKDSNRKYFTGKLAPKDIRSIFKDKRIPDRFTKKGQSNPVLYSRK